MKTRLSFVANFALFLMLVSLVQPAAFGQGKKWAVLVGINKYESDAMSPLTYSVPDVQAVAKRLSALGFAESQLFVLTSDLPASSANHPTHTNIIKRLDRLAKLIEPDDTLLFYFSGHGFQRENGQHFLATVNADPDSIFTLQNSTLSVAILQEMMKRIKARQVVFILDACREEPEKGAKGDPDNKLTSDFSKRILLVTEGSGAGAAGSGTLFACSEGQRSWEWAAKGQGAFTYYLLEGLDGKAADEGGNLTLQNVAKYIQGQMRVWGIQENKTQIPSLETKGAAEIVLGRVSRTSPEPKPKDPKPGGKVNPKDTNAYLDIVTNPVGATVYVEGQPLAGAKTPYRYIQEMGLNRQAEIEVGVRLPGYKDAVRSVMLERGNVTTLTLTLEPVTPKPEPKPEPIFAPVGVPFGGTYPKDPDSVERSSVPKGEVTQMPNFKSKIFPETDRKWWIYVPAQYTADKPACVMIFQDGGGYKNNVPNVFDNLIAEKAMPVTVGVFIQPGDLLPGREKRGYYQRSFEYDTLSDQYSRFLLEEILPEVEKTVKLRHDAASRAVAGFSSGAICAFTVAWQRPDQFSKVLSWIGSYTNLAGGHTYPAMIRRTDPKPIRVFLQDGDHDLDNQFGNWPLANQEMAKALDAKKYDYKFVFGHGDHNPAHGYSILGESLRWLWRDYKGE